MTGRSGRTDFESKEKHWQNDLCCGTLMVCSTLLKKGTHTMKHSLLMLSLIFGHTSFCMESVVPTGRELKTQNGTVAVTVEMQEEPAQLERMPVPQWKKEVDLAARNRNSKKLIHLLSPEGRPAPTRGRFIPYDNALEQIKAHREREERILNNTAEPDAKCCKCCNLTYVWNRALAPTILVGVALGQIGFSAAALAAAIQKYQTQTLTSVAEVVELVVPIGTFVAGLGNFPFSLWNAYRRFTLKDTQGKYEYYVIAEHNVETHDHMEKLLLENQASLKELLARDPNPHTRAHQLLKRLDQLSELEDEQTELEHTTHNNNNTADDQIVDL